MSGVFIYGFAIGCVVGAGVMMAACLVWSVYVLRDLNDAPPAGDRGETA